MKKDADILTIPSFFNEAEKLREYFVSCFENPLKADSRRFTWDYWHVPNQYTVLRTPAYHFFPKPIYDRLHTALRTWGQAHLGCHDISPPWLSCYIDGCHQKLHGDLPHGPWAYVYSLTDWEKRIFSGGETLLMNNDILDYWNSDKFADGLEETHIFRKVEPRFNQLTVFDPRIPHGVNEVKGTQDVSRGRLVIHGWFIQPNPFVVGKLPRASLNALVSSMLSHLQELFGTTITARGVLNMRFTILPSGKVTSFHVLSNTLKGGIPGQGKDIEKILTKFMKLLHVDKPNGKSIVTLPLIFD